MRSYFSLTVLAAIAATTSVAAQDCGPGAYGKKCPQGQCCSVYNWCGTTPQHCAADCLEEFSGPGSPCGAKPTTTEPAAFPSTVPSIDSCGPSAKVSCPGAGLGGYFYRCCSKNGHCGPKNSIQDSADYCGTGCQPGWGLDCNPSRSAPPKPATPPSPVLGKDGDNCGPIVNRKCGPGLCCSGSNFCGTGKDFCGAANWCQEDWGTCGGV